MWHDGVQGRGHAGGRKVAYGMTSMGTGTLEKEKASNFRGGCPPRKSARHPGKGKTNEISPLSNTFQKKNKKILLFLLTK